MSNEFMSVPRDLLERIYEKVWPMHGVSKELRTLLDAPADKGQREPVVMPKRIPGDDGVCTESHYAKGWNDGLDEITRLNPEPKP